MGWIDIKEELYSLIETMTILNGYNYNWSAKKNSYEFHPESVYARIIANEEENQDYTNNVGIDQYKQRRTFDFYVYAAATIGDDIDPDEVRENSIDALELALVDLKNMFNGVINDTLCAAGCRMIQYIEMSFVDDDKAGVSAPVKMLVEYDIDYLENRNIG